MKKLAFITLIFIFVISLCPQDIYASMLPEFLCEIGLKFYQQGRYEEALHEFRKALIIQPDYAPAIRYVQMIQQLGLKEEVGKEIVPPIFKPRSTDKAGAVTEALDFIEMHKEMVQERQLSGEPLSIPGIAVQPVSPQGLTLPKIVTLDDSLATLPQPIQIEMKKSIYIMGNNIKRFLLTEPSIAKVEKEGPDRLLVTGNDIGYTYLNIWDDNGRWTVEFLGVFAKPEGPTYEEIIRKEEEVAKHFKLRYSLDWDSYKTGRGFNDWKRISYFWAHNLQLNGPSPYGNLESLFTIRKSKSSTDLTYLTLGLTDGQFGNLKGFNLHAFDYLLPFDNLACPPEDLRGVILSSPAFDKHIYYNMFWGREGGGRYGNLSPGLTKTKNSFLAGMNLDFSPTQKQDYKFTVVHGWGRDRENYLNRYDYDLLGTWHLPQWGLSYEIANDTDTFAHLFKADYKKPKFNFSSEIRNISKNFYSITGNGWRQGELGTLFNLNYTPLEKLKITSSLDFFRDRLFPAEDNPERWNEDFNFDTIYQIDPATSWTSTYTFQNDLGQLSQFRYLNAGLGFSKKITFFKDMYANINGFHQENTSYSAHASDYINDKALFGIRVSLMGPLYYYINEEINWLQERYYAKWANPRAMETGLDWNSQIGKTPFYGSCRFTYRDEEDTVSNISLLSGEDYIEGYSELTYRPTPNAEVYGSLRIRNVWADNPNVSKHLDGDFNAGLRYVWDTGISWDAVGNIEGYVFKDYNSDGLRQRDEPPVQGIKIWLGKNKSQVTDMFGYYVFKGVRARKSYVNLDTTTLPPGYIVTVPVTQEVSISHHRTVRADFGIIVRSEITGYVFEDANADQQYGRQDIGIAGAVIILDDEKKTVTDSSGRYVFANTTPGEHTLKLDLNSLPVYYLPKASVTKKLLLMEGATYIYNVPLRRIEE